MAKMKLKSVDVLEGNLYRSIIRYSIPLLLMALVQKLFNAVDVMVLNVVADTTAVASVGATSSTIHLLVDSFFGLSVGSRVVLARLLGAKDEDRVRKTAATSLIFAVIMGIIVAVVGVIFAPYFLEWTKCPAECVDGALVYMHFYLCGAAAILLYNFASAIIQVMGDANRPMIYMMISGVTNVILNFILCLVLEEKVAAVAIATVVSQALGALLALLRLFRMSDTLGLCLKSIRWSWSSLGLILKNGLPVAIYSAMYPLANLQIQTQVNSFGAAHMAAVTATSNLDNILSSISNTPMITAVATFAGQNLGAGNRERVTKTFLFCTAVSASIGLIFGILGNVFSRPLLSLFLSDEAAIAAGRTRLLFLMLPYFITGINGCLSRAIQTFGYSAYVTVNSIVTVIGFRFFWTWVVFERYPTFEVLCLCFPVSWTLTLLVNIPFFLYLYYGKFKKGKLQKL